MSALYASFLHDHTAPLILAELPVVYECLSERHLQVVWLEQKYMKNLKTASGEEIQVLSPGIWNTEAGPDFLKAHLKIGGAEYKGDIEIHLNDDSWQQHEHHKDGNYNQVILHVSLWKPKTSQELMTANGIPLQRLYLEECLTVPHARLMQLIDLELYPYKKFVGSGRCAHTLFKSLPEQKILSFFQHAAQWRLNQKAQNLRTHVAANFMGCLGTQFGAAIAITLGYKNNPEPFLQLFLHLLDKKIANENEAIALGLKAFGFFEGYYKEKWGKSYHYCYLEKLASQSKFPLPSLPLSLNKIRPLNHPIRRLVTLIKILSDQSHLVLFQSLINLWAGSWKTINSHKEALSLCEKLRNQLPSYKDSYWSRHFLFEKSVSPAFVPLLGENIKHEILVNAFFPLLHEKISQNNDPRELEVFYLLYSCLPAAKTGKTKYLIHRFFGDSPKGKIINKAYIEQGAYQLHKDFCIHYEASCEGCPFVEKYKRHFLDS